MTTKLIYLDDFDVLTGSATITDVSVLEDDRTDVQLDQTCFYPRGGGQDWDTGTINGANGTLQVNEVRLDDAGIAHHIGNLEGTLSINDSVSCTVDEKRRSVNTRLHSAGHVIDMAIDSLGLDWVAIKGQHYPHLSAVEYEGSWDPDDTDIAQKIEVRANELIAKGTENSVRFIPVAEMHTIVRHVPTNIPTNKPARVVMYGDSFGIPCGGTHVKNLQQVGIVHVPKVKQKKGVIRVNYTVEGIN